MLPLTNLRHSVEKLTSRYDLGVGPFRREVLQIAGHDVMGTRSLCAFQKNIVIGVGTGMHFLGRLDPKPILPDSAECDSMTASLRLSLGTPYHLFVFGIDIAADAKLSGGPCERASERSGQASLVVVAVLKPEYSCRGRRESLLRGPAFTARFPRRRYLGVNLFHGKLIQPLLFRALP